MKVDTFETLCSGPQCLFRTLNKETYSKRWAFFDTELEIYISKEFTNISAIINAFIGGGGGGEILLIAIVFTTY